MTTHAARPLHPRHPPTTRASPGPLVGGCMFGGVAVWVLLGSHGDTLFIPFLLIGGLLSAIVGLVADQRWRLARAANASPPSSVLRFIRRLVAGATGALLLVLGLVWVFSGNVGRTTSLLWVIGGAGGVLLLLGALFQDHPFRRRHHHVPSGKHRAE